MSCKSLNNLHDKEFHELLKIIENADISTVYQPIASLTDGSIIGYEALSRGPKNSLLQSPDKLFSAAKLHNRTWELELLCRTRAIEKASDIPDDKFLFINVDPYIFKDEKFKRGFTKEFLSKNNISSEIIIFEITEKTSIEDYKNFRAVLNNYIEQGYKIAIDDTGSGYSGLKMLSEIQPHYIKIDMDLTRNIHKDTFKQALIECFVRLSEVTNMKLIAEGIENTEELKTLINLGVYAGQGYFISPPAGAFLDIPDHVKNTILSCHKMKNARFISSSNNYIGKITRLDKPFNTNTTCKIIREYFYNNNTITGACIVNDTFPVGLIMKHSLDSVFATQYGAAIFSKRPISLVMDSNPIIVDYYIPVNQVSKIAMEREIDNIYDYIIVTKNNKYYGIVTIKTLLNYTTMLEYNYAKQLNPLTELPGNSIIENKLRDILSLNKKCCILYFDLDNFKVYNDTYGFENGDKVIKFTSEVIRSEIGGLFSCNSFVGHIGGDDFFSIIENSLDSCLQLCENIIKKFDTGILDFLNEKDKANGYIKHIDRKGNKDIFTLPSISIAGIYGNIGNFSSIEAIGEKTALVKKEAKSIKKSCYIIKECY